MATPPELTRFEIRRPLGEGGSGAVYLAWDRDLGREVALKLVSLRADVNSMLAEERKGAILQQKIARKAPQAPEVFGFGEERGFFWIAMEYIEGADLSAAIKDAPFTEMRAAQISIQICQFLGVLHEFIGEVGDRKILGIVHGDLKPENIRLQSEDRVRVVDFGLARNLSISRNYTHSSFGTLPYTPPEQIRDEVATLHSDLWAVGVILYQMTSGRSPVQGGSFIEVRRQILEHELLPLPNSCSRPLRYIINKSLQNKVSDRYPSAAALRDDLQKFTKGVFPGSHAGKKQDPHKTTIVRAGRKADDLTLTLPQPEKKPIPDESLAHEGKHDTGPLRVPDDKRRELFKARPGRIKAAMGLVLVVALILSGCQVYVWHGAEDIRRSLISDPVKIDESWKRFQMIQFFDFFGIARRTVQEEIKLALFNAGNAILVQYAESDRPVDKPRWGKALSYFTAATELDGGAQKFRARSAFCRGHLALIDSKDSKKQKNFKGTHEKQDEAIADFLQASRLDAAWADPRLSLAATYVYYQFDLAKLTSEVAEAQRRGCHNLRLLKALLADGHYRQAQFLSKQARNLKADGQDRAIELLGQALKELDTAIGLYKEIPGYAKVEQNRSEVETLRDRIQRRIGTLAPAPSPLQASPSANM